MNYVKIIKEVFDKKIYTQNYSLNKIRPVLLVFMIFALIWSKVYLESTVFQ